MNALVTGGAGFIGSNVAALLLEEGHSVTIIDDLSTGHKENLEELGRARFVQGDIRDRKLLDSLMADADTVFHLAASVGNVRSIENPVLDSDVNVLGTLQVLESAVRHGVKKLVYCSSAAIFGEPKKLPMDEAHPFAPDSPYGVSKLAGELQALCFAKLYGISVVCLRYFNVYGPNQRFDAYGNVIPIFVTRLLDGQPLQIFGDGNQTRDFVNVADVAQANLRAAERSGITGAFNIGAGRSTTINDLAELVEAAVGRKSKVIYAPARKGEVLHSLADISAARATLGYQPRVDLDSGLRAYVAWMRKAFKVPAAAR